MDVHNNHQNIATRKRRNRENPARDASVLNGDVGGGERES